MTTLLIKEAHVLVTMDDERRELADSDVLIRDGVIAEIGSGIEVAAADETLDVRNCVVTPGLVNTHHHLFQTLTRAVPAAQDARLFGWLKALYPNPAKPEPNRLRYNEDRGTADFVRASHGRGSCWTS
jgi:cytosine/adenosine deaminase-related metal-dependent hydrolase